MESFQIDTKYILFYVNVPVLSEQIISAPPIVSQAANFLTKLLSFNILLVEYAKDSVTANGNPSGIATTITVIAIITKLSNSFTWSPVNESSDIRSTINLMINMQNINKADINPNLPISVAILSNFSYKGVVYESSDLSKLAIFPKQLESPTTSTNIFPSPESTLVPLNKIGEGTSCLPAVALIIEIYYNLLIL